jgi:glycosyltransferase involved in cell wall biosynthesis
VSAASDRRRPLETAAALPIRNRGRIGLSVVIPVYDEVEALPELYRALAATLDELPLSAEIVFADDGSKDGSGAVLDGLAAADPRVRVVHLSRNYGQTAALMAAIQESTGEVIVPMDGDGQNDPADIPRLLAKLNEGHDVVSGWRQAREDRALTRRLPSRLANRLISALLRVPLHDYGCTLKAYRREVVEDVRLYGEMHRFIPIYAAWEGARVAELPVAHHPRRFGRSKYGLGRVARVVPDLLLVYFIDRAFDRPMQFFGKIAFAFLGLSLLTFAWALFLKFGFGASLVQTPLPLLAAVIGLSGVLFLLLGIIAEIQVRIYFEARGRPPYRIKGVVQHAAMPEMRAAPRRW